MVATGISYAWTFGTKPNPRLSIIGRMVPLVHSKNCAQRNSMAKTIVRGMVEVYNVICELRHIVAKQQVNMAANIFAIFFVP
jgi:hypothetical protein